MYAASDSHNLFAWCSGIEQNQGFPSWLQRIARYLNTSDRYVAYQRDGRKSRFCPSRVMPLKKAIPIMCLQKSKIVTGEGNGVVRNSR